MGLNLDYGIFEFLSIAKDLYDHDLLDRVVETGGNAEVSEDFYSLAWEGIFHVFEYFRQYYRESTGIETMVFCDPVITKFYRLCSLYESQKGITKEDDPFRQNGEKDVYGCFCLDAYDYDVFLYDGDHGSPRLILLSGEEFCGLTELPEALLEARDTYKTYCRRLGEALTAKNPGTAAPEYVEKEAA